MKATQIGLWLVVLVAVLGCGPQAQPPKGGAPGGPQLPSIEDATKGLNDATKGLNEAAKGAVEDAQKGIDGAVSKAGEALKGVEGGQEALNGVSTFFKDATDTLSSIKDVESAKAALPKLEALGLNADTIKATLGKLPAEARTAIAGAIDSGVASLKSLAATIEAIPGVKEQVKPTLDALITKVESWKA